ncbi:hypothetical protein DSECCO2_418020 [anaerobic digester metagenome]
MLGSRCHQIVRFVHHQVIVLTESGIFHAQVGQQQSVICHHHRGILDLLAQAHHMAFLVMHALAIAAEIAV